MQSLHHVEDLPPRYESYASPRRRMWRCQQRAPATWPLRCCHLLCWCSSFASAARTYTRLPTAPAELSATSAAVFSVRPLLLSSFKLAEWVRAANTTAVAVDKERCIDTAHRMMSRMGPSMRPDPVLPGSAVGARMWGNRSQQQPFRASLSKSYSRRHRKPEHEPRSWARKRVRF